jgi:putative (di)nucleoside polyphosphate hydrolase
MTIDTSTRSLYRQSVGALLINANGQVFVGQRLDTAGDAWQMPQGGIERGEAPCDAVLREIKEEIGTDKVAIVAQSDNWRCYDLPPEIAAKMWGGKYKGQRMKWFALSFRGGDHDIDVERVAHPEFKTWKWIEPSKLPSVIVSFKKPLYEEILNEFESVLKQFAAK